MSVYKISAKVNKKSGKTKPVLESAVSKCLYLDEIIDVKIVKREDEESMKPS